MLTGCDYKSIELDSLLLQIFWKRMSKCYFGAKADGMVALPVEGCFRLRIVAEFVCL